MTDVAQVDSALTTSPAVSRFETREPEVAMAHMAAIYGPHALLLEGGAMNMRLRGFEIADLHVGEISYGTPAIASMSHAHPCWVFSYLREGSVRHGRDGPRVHAGTGGVNSPDAVMDLVMSADMDLINLRIGEQEMRDACRSLLGSDLAERLQFEVQLPPGSAPIATLLRLMSQLAVTPRYAHALAGRFERSVREATLFELLLGWPNNAAPAFEVQPALPASTRRARDYIHAHAAELPTVVEIAEACHVGVRALARGFDKHLGTSPLRYMLDYRLDRVREVLRRGANDTTVTRVALDWGFLHLGSFAQRYRTRFGETPSETLRRAAVAAATPERPKHDNDTPDPR